MLKVKLKVTLSNEIWWFLLLINHVLFLHYRGEQVPSYTCITYDAVNQAYVDARKRIRKFSFKRFFFCANFDGWLNEKQLVKTINYPHKQVSRPQKANGSRRILPQSVNYCWICQFSWRERESSSITLHHELVSYCNVCLWFSANLFSDFFSLCSNPNQAAIQWSTLKKLHNEFTPRENSKLKTGNCHCKSTRKWIVIDRLYVIWLLARVSKALFSRWAPNAF